MVEKLQGKEHIVGFTTRYIAGGTLAAEGCRVFKLKWLKQLLCVIDNLNFKYGIQHQDVAPRNILLHEATDDIMLFDFNNSARMNAPFDPRLGGTNFDEHRDDVKGVIFTLYEIITRNKQSRNIKPSV